MCRCAVTGSFDPFTLGHLDIVRRARNAFDEVLVVVATSDEKSYLFDVDARCEIARRSVDGIVGVRVLCTDGYVADFCKGLGIEYAVRGIRGGGDLAYELRIAAFNKARAGIETLFLQGNSDISASKVRELLKNKQDISNFVSKNALDVIQYH